MKRLSPTRETAAAISRLFSRVSSLSGRALFGGLSLTAGDELLKHSSTPEHVALMRFPQETLFSLPLLTEGRLAG